MSLRPGSALAYWAIQRRPCFAAALPGLLAWALMTSGCTSPAEVQLRREVVSLRAELDKSNNSLEDKRLTITRLQQQLDQARGIAAGDLTKIFYPERLEIGNLTGGFNRDNQPGDDGVVVYLTPVDRFGDAIKVAGEVTIQLYDLNVEPGQPTLLGEYPIGVEQLGKLWHGKLMASHYTIRCPWLGAPPEHEEVTVRAIFVDYLTKRVVSAQDTCQVALPPR